tara:strand:- start:1669 stop:2592 length:924 start_codon:yes stop_codon:yes gene_type:complete
MSEEKIEETQNHQEQLNSIYEQILHKGNDIPVDEDNLKDSEEVKQEDSSKKEELGNKDKEITSTTKDATEESKEIKIEEKKGRVESSTKYKDLEKQVNDAKQWGQNKNRQLISTKRKISDIVSKLNIDGALPEEEAQSIFNSLNQVEDDTEEEQEEEKKVINPFLAVKEKLDGEFTTFKRYNKSTDIDEKYEAFYSFFPMLSEKDQEESFTYLQDAEPDVALDYIMTHGSELYDNIFKGAKEKGGVLKYVKSLQTKLDKLQKKSSELEVELDVTTKKVYNKPNNSEAESSDSKTSTAKEFYSQRYHQ